MDCVNVLPNLVCWAEELTKLLCAKVAKSSAERCRAVQHASKFSFVRCVQRYTDDRGEYIEQHRANCLSPLQTIKAFLEDAVTNITTGQYSCFAIKAAFEVATDDPRIKSILQADDEFMYRFLRSLLADAMKKGEIRKEDPELLTDYLLSVYTGWHESFILHRNPLKIQRMAHYLITQLSR